MQLCDLVLLLKPLSCSPGKKTYEIELADVVEDAAVHRKIQDFLALGVGIGSFLYRFDIVEEGRFLSHDELTEGRCGFADHL